MLSQRNINAFSILLNDSVLDVVSELWAYRTKQSSVLTWTWRKGCAGFCEEWLKG